MKKLAMLAAVVLGAMGVVATAAIADHGKTKKLHSGAFGASLNSYQEVFAGGGAVSTTGRGSFRAQVKDDPLRIEYTLRYEGLEGSPTLFAHIHFGQPHTTGGVSAFLCGGGGKDSCPNGGGTVSGTILAANVVGPAGQGIAEGELGELIRAMRAGATYANVHTQQWPAGEIRGLIRGGKGTWRGR